jgi:hypothetical protein
MDKPSIIEMVLVRDMRSGNEWFEDAPEYAVNPIRGTVVIHEKPRMPDPIVCEARYFTAFTTGDCRPGASVMRKLMEEQMRMRFLRGQ